MTGSQFTVRVVRRQFAAEVSIDPSLTALLKRSGAAHGREWLPERGAWLVHGTRVDRLLDAFAQAGLPVDLVEPHEPGGRE